MKEFVVWLFSGECLALAGPATTTALVLTGLGTTAACLAIFLRWFLVRAIDEWRVITEPYESVAPRSVLSVFNMIAAVSIGPPTEEFLFRSWAVWLWLQYGWHIGLPACAVSVWLTWAGHRYDPVRWAVKDAAVYRPTAMAEMQGVCGALYLVSDITTGSMLPGLVAHLTWNCIANLWDLGVINAEATYEYAQSLSE